MKFCRHSAFRTARDNQPVPTKPLSQALENPWIMCNVAQVFLGLFESMERSSGRFVEFSLQLFGAILE